MEARQTAGAQIMVAEQMYEIVCLQGAPLSSWGEPRTLEEVRLQFWDYAITEDMFQDEEDVKFQIEYDEESGMVVMPDWFDIQLIEDVWEVKVSRLKGRQNV